MRFRAKQLLALLIFLVACTRSELPEVTATGLPTEKLNTEINLNAPAGWNDHKVGNAITLSIKNVSDDELIFNSDYGVRIFMYSENEWIEIKDQLISLNDNTVILKPNKTKPESTGTITILPKLNSSKGLITLRIFVMGNVYKDGVREKTGAFIDIVLNQ